MKVLRLTLVGVLIAVVSIVVGAPAAQSSPHGVWPVRPAIMVAGFSPPTLRWQAGHRGIDLATTPGESVVAAASGVVSFAAELAGRGVVVIDHGALRTTYEPVQPAVKEGQFVQIGQTIGRIAPGSGHCGDGHCLHWGLRRSDRYLDPRILLGLRPVLKRIV